MVLKYLNPFIKRVGTSKKKNIQQMANLKDSQKSPNSSSKHAVGYFCFTGSLLEHDFSWHKAELQISHWVLPTKPSKCSSSSWDCNAA